MARAGMERENDKSVFLFPLCLLSFLLPLAEVSSAFECFAVPMTDAGKQEASADALSQRRSHHFHGKVCFSSWA